jgi:hypothetical protein
MVEMLQDQGTDMVEVDTAAVDVACFILLLIQ